MKPVISLLNIVQCDITKKEKKILRIKTYLKTLENKILTPKRIQFIKHFNDKMADLQDSLHPMYLNKKYLKYADGRQKTWGEY